MKNRKMASGRSLMLVTTGLMASGLAFGPLYAADLGGDCCADLEERISELEATTVRKGNRRVSLKISGHVSRAIGWYEDEFGDSEVYASGFGPSGSRIIISGQTKLNENLTAGYKIRFRTRRDRNRDVLTSAGGSAGPGTYGIGRDRDYVYLTHKRLGTISLGHQGIASDDTTNVSLSGHRVFNNAGRKWNRSSIQGFEIEQDSSEQSIKYTAPTIEGFTFSVAWADQNIASNAAGGGGSALDLVDFGLFFAREFGSVRVAAGLGYVIVDDNEFGDGSSLMGSVAFIHTPSGVNAAFSAGTDIDGGLPLTISNANRTGAVGTDAHFWHIEGGIYRDYFGFGKTSIFGEYGLYDYDEAGYNFRGTTYTDDSVEMWGLGIVQHFDQAATEIFLGYRQWNQDTLDPVAVAAGHDGDVKQVTAGMRIKF